MLTDLGLATTEQIESYKKLSIERVKNNFTSCISSAICYKCLHIISDSICCCAGFKCPNCGQKNYHIVEFYSPNIEDIIN